jgi:hypothetical protein
MTTGFYSYASVDEAEQTEADRFPNLIAWPPIDPDWDGVGPNLMMPNPECGLTIEQIATKDVPEGSPYVILTYHDFPWEDSFNMLFQYKASWRVNFADPDGVGENENG